MRMPDLTEMATRALVAVCVLIAAGSVIGELVRRAGPFLIPLIALGLAGWAIWAARFKA